MSQPDTAERILDAAEKLFAHNGYHNTSMRAITGEAEVNLASVNYHYGSKEALLEEVFKRRLIPLNAIRSEALNSVQSQAVEEGRRPEVADVLRAFVEPTVRYCCREPGATHFSALVGRSMSDTDATVRTIFLQYILPLFKQLSSLLDEALPDVAPERVFWRLQFVIGATSHIMRMLGKEDGFMNQMHTEMNIETIIEELMTFVTAGTEAK
jgi:AcrR family transcriptional regulator